MNRCTQFLRDAQPMLLELFKVLGLLIVITTILAAEVYSAVHVLLTFAAGP